MCRALQCPRSFVFVLFVYLANVCFDFEFEEVKKTDSYEQLRQCCRLNVVFSGKSINISAELRFDKYHGN